MGIADDMNSENKKITKEDFKEYTYVMVSTLNQMVNYIPLKHFEFKEVYNITTKVERDKDSKKIIKYFDNEKWDENLKKVLDDEPIKIEIEKNNFFDLILVQNRLKKEIETGVLKDKNIFWNITGGQRHIMMAISQLAKSDDIICYIEGNNNQMMIYEVATNSVKPVEYSLNLKKNLTIDIALRLMGLQFNSCNEEIGQDKERKFYQEFYSKYIDNKKLREWLIILNKNYPKIRDKEKKQSDENYQKYKNEYQTKKQKFNKLKEESKDKIKKFLSDLDKTMLETKLNRSQAFGYILEELTFYKIEELLKSQIEKKKVKLVHSLKVKNEDINNVTIAEFDIALLTDSGKFIMFECKSGVMKGDVAKSRKYATYAVSGVYGLPILITPLIASETTENEDGKLESNITKDLDIDIYKYIKEATSSAKRASLEVWGLDEIEDKLKKYIDLG